MLAAVLVCVGLSSCAQAPVSPGDFARGVVRAYDANRALSTRGVVHYQYFKGEAADQAKARSGDWTDRTRGDCVFAFDGPKGRFERVYSLEVLAAHTVVKGNLISSTLIPEKSLTNGKETLVDFTHLAFDGKSISHRLQINPGTEDFTRHSDFIRSLGNAEHRDYDLYELRNALAGKDGYRVEPPKDARLDDGAAVVLIEIIAKGRRVDYWFDLDHGAVLRGARGFEPDGALSFLVDYDDVRRINAAAWFPFHRLEYEAAVNKIVDEYRIVDADVKNPPDDSVFRLAFEKPIAVLDTVRQLHYSERLSWDLIHLPVPGTPQARHVNILVPADPAAKP